jgi:hypothetical protein
MSINQRIGTLERILTDDSTCSACGAPRWAYRPRRPVDDETIGGCCPRCRRLLDRDGRPLDYAVLVIGGAVEMNDGALIWGADGGPIRVPGGALKLMHLEDEALLGPI